MVDHNLSTAKLIDLPETSLACQEPPVGLFPAKLSVYELLIDQLLVDELSVDELSSHRHYKILL
jgi:hypothetical protein